MKSSLIALISALCLQQAHAIRAYECEECASLSHDPISTSWMINSQPIQPIITREEHSVKYRFSCSSEDLNKGVALETTVPGAIVHIVPKGDKSNYKPSLIIQKDDRVWSMQNAASFVDDDQSNPAFQLKHELGKGKFILRQAIQGSQAGPEQFTIYVYDKGSSIALDITTDKLAYLLGDELTASFDVGSSLKSYPIEKVSANIITADGDKIPLTLKADPSNHYTAKIKLAEDKNPHGANWHIEADIVTKVNDQVINRHGHAAFSYAIPSAKIELLRFVKKGPFTFKADLDVATSSRYAIQAVLFATDDKGEKQPIGYAQSANWLDAGKATLDFIFPNEVANQYNPPYYLGSIELIDYGQIKPVDKIDKLINIKELG